MYVIESRVSDAKRMIRSIELKRVIGGGPQDEDLVKRFLIELNWKKVFSNNNFKIMLWD